MTAAVLRPFAAALALAACAAVAGAQVTVRGVTALRWGTSEGSVGFQGATVEDFEDTTLAPGLSVFWSAPAGTVGPVTTLPRTFDPSADDPFGTAFNNGAWDGTHALISAMGNQSYAYSASQNWGDVELRFDPPVKAVGFSMQQADAEISLVVNGASVGGLSALSGLPFSGGRAGYVVVTATGSGTISTLRLDNSGGDGFVIDHLLYTTQPAPVVSVTGFPATTWPRRDGELGITPVQVEDFEDVNLVPGLQIGWEAPAGVTPLSSTLPQTFDPLAQDPFGNVFESSVWDGTHCILNTRDNASHQYVGTLEWGDVIFAFNPPRQSVGFSVAQTDAEARLVVNGRDVGGLLALSGLTAAEGRQGYVRIDTPCGGAAISEVRLNNTRYFVGVADGIGIDHLTFGTPIGFAATPVAAAICHGAPAEFSVQVAGLGPFTYQWQIETSPGNWMTLGNDPGPLPGGGAAFATPINSPTVHIGVLNRTDLFRVRCVASNACANAASPPARLFINPADCGRAGGLPGSDGQYDNNDFIAFITFFFALDPHADMGRAGGLFGDDGAFDNNDFIAFINQFFAGC